MNELNAIVAATRIHDLRVGVTPERTRRVARDARRRGDRIRRRR